MWNILEAKGGKSNMWTPMQAARYFCSGAASLCWGAIQARQAGRSMEDKQFSSCSLCIHPAYGSIYRDGEFVQRGCPVGLSIDARAVIVAPISGWVRMLPDVDAKLGIGIEIRQQPTDLLAFQQALSV